MSLIVFFVGGEKNYLLCRFYLHSLLELLKFNILFLNILFVLIVIIPNCGFTGFK